MTIQQFNEKYKHYIEPGFYGLTINNAEFIQWLDQKFKNFVQKPGFKFSQIKVKFGTGRFYAEGISRAEIDEVEDKITEVYNNIS